MNKKILLLAAFAAAVALPVLAPVWPWTQPKLASLKSENPETTALMRLRDKQARRKGRAWRADRRWVPLSRVSEHLKNAVIAAEDGGFYAHGGVEWGLMRDALIYDLKQLSWARGASTITQQLAKNLYLSPSKNPLRKVREMSLAFRFENRLSKNRILELYLNAVEWGDGIFGAEAAARAHFGKSAADLTLDEAVALAAVLPSPRRHSPAGGSRWVAQRKAWVERRMRATGRWPEVEIPPLPVPDAELPLEQVPGLMPSESAPEITPPTAEEEFPPLPPEDEEETDESETEEIPDAAPAGPSPAVN